MRPEDKYDAHGQAEHEDDDVEAPLDEMAIALIEEQADRNIRREWYDGR